MFISTVLNPLGTALLAIVANWDKITSAIQSAYDWFKSWTDKWNNTTLSDKEVNITQNTSYADAPDGDQVSFNPYQHKATGTQYSRGGLTVVGEYGPELIDAQRGSKIYTNSQTNKILSGNSNIPPVYVIIQGNVIGNEEFADSVGQHIYNKLYYQMVNS
jgi:phage-related tail protein